MRPYKTEVLTDRTSDKLADSDVLRRNLVIPEQGSSSDELERCNQAASRIVERYCDRVFSSQGYRSWVFNEDYQVPVVRLYLPQYPVSSVTEFESSPPKEVNFTPLTWEADLDYRIDGSDGVLFILERIPAGMLRVSFTAGYSQVPADIAEVVLQLTRDIFLRRARESTIEQESIPDQASASYFETTELLSMPQKRVLDTYRNLQV